MTFAPGINYSTTTFTSANGANDTNAILRTLRSWTVCSEQTVKNLAIFVREGSVELIMTNLDPQGEWNGEVLIAFKTEFSKERMVNYIISGSQADEMHMIDENTLRLWWD